MFTYLWFCILPIITYIWLRITIIVLYDIYYIYIYIHTVINGFAFAHARSKCNNNREQYGNDWFCTTMGAKHFRIDFFSFVSILINDTFLVDRMWQTRIYLVKVREMNIFRSTYYIHLFLRYNNMSV